MKAIIKSSILALTLLSAGATAMAREPYRDGGYSYRGHGYEGSRYAAPEVLYDRYGNRVYVSRSERYAAPERCAPVVVPEYHRPPVCEERRPSIRFVPPPFSPLRFIFGR